METNFSRRRHDPLALIKKFWPEADVSHIEYDPMLRRGEFDIVRQIGSDGTHVFTYSMLQDALFQIVGMRCCLKSKIPENQSTIKVIRYRIGPMRHVTVYGRILLSEHMWPGQRERVRMPVISEIITE